MNFPKDFTWGAAAASYQIEGGAYEDGKGLSVWDMMCREPGRIWEGNTGDVACDHYHRYKEDIGLMSEIGLKAYRLSVSWPRVMPDGTGRVNKKGLAFYDRLVDGLLAHGIEPWVTLFHWDYPYALYRRGGWLNPESPDWFADYATIVVKKLSDRVSHWMTLNEPECFIGLGHQTGEHAPGLKLGFAQVLQAGHHALLAHGKAVQVIRAHARSKPCIGAAPVGSIRIPVSNRPGDVQAARQDMFSVTGRNFWNNAWFADPMILGKYPEDGLRRFGKDLPAIGSRDMKTICQPLDFYGANIYWGACVRRGADGKPEGVQGPDGPPLTTMTWKVRPASLYWGPRFFYERYRLPIVITENGMANCDWVHTDGKVHDPQRIDFMRRYLTEYRRAASDGVKVKGYFYWSILDNFEWGHGYKQRFGIVFVDYATGKRTLKDSAYWYRDVIATNGRIIGRP
jgi:beta-glucosidase